MAAETGVNDELFAVVGFCEFEEEDSLERPLIVYYIDLQKRTDGKPHKRTVDKS
jgi:hypothetical protein